MIKVGIADQKMAKAPDKIKTTGLGSCVGLVLYDLNRQVAGLAHIMLPDSSLAKQANLNPYKYADTAIDRLIEKLCSAGAHMFEFASNNDLIRIGSRNVQAVQEKLNEHHIVLKAKDVGGNSGRTIEFDPASGTLKIRTIYQGESII
jgi:chemotaxis protein CheD